MSYSDPDAALTVLVGGSGLSVNGNQLRFSPLFYFQPFGCNEFSPISKEPENVAKG
ncbi:hypothetical protein [Pantoea sp. AS142]|uniref:hypothetical protein n=1 Tax=Pantoea sp. AS142 TaxID=3081292 RepID=UPI0030160890